MAVNTQTLFDYKLLKYSATSESDSFTTAFFYSLTRVIEDLNSEKVGLSIDSVPISLESDIDVGSKYFGVISDGMDYYLADTGMWGQKDTAISRAEYFDMLGRAHTEVLADTNTLPRLGTS